MRVELGAFGSVVGSLPIELLGNVTIMEYLINITIENMLYGLWGNSSKFSGSLRVYKIFHFVR